MTGGSPFRRHVVLGLDTGSPVVSVAAAATDGVLAESAVELRRSSERLLVLIDEVLAAAGTTPGELLGIVVTRGPGSFTGLRVGLATGLAFQQALGCQAAAPPTLLVLAAWARARLDVRSCRAVVEGLRGQWWCQTFDCSRASTQAPRPLDAISSWQAGQLLGGGPAIVGFGASKLAAADAGIHEPGPLAGIAALLGAHGAWSWAPAELLDPLYLAAPATTGFFVGPAAPAT